MRKGPRLGRPLGDTCVVGTAARRVQSRREPCSSGRGSRCELGLPPCGSWPVHVLCHGEAVPGGMMAQQPPRPFQAPNASQHPQTSSINDSSFHGLYLQGGRDPSYGYGVGSCIIVKILCKVFLQDRFIRVWVQRATGGMLGQCNLRTSTGCCKDQGVGRYNWLPTIALQRPIGNRSYASSQSAIA